jgi:HK97 family phage major capsid protein
VSVIAQRNLTSQGEKMSEFIRTQQEVRANLIAQVREVIDIAESEARGLTAEDTQKIDRIEADIRRADEAIEIATRSESRRAEAVTAAGSFAPVAEAPADLFRSMARGEVRGHEFLPETRATLVSSANSVPVSFYDQVFGAARLVGPWLDVADVITRSTGGDLRLPIYTAFSTAAAVTAGSAIPESNPTFNSVLVSPAKFAFLVPVANELVNDAGFDIQSVIATQAGNAIGTYLNSSVTTTVVAAATVGATASTATDISSDNLLDLAFSTDGAVRQLPTAGYMVNSKTLGSMRKLKDNVGAYLYQVGVGAPSTFAGFPVYENPNLADIATTTKSVLFGDFSAVKIVTTGMQVATSVDAYFANDATVYRFAMRAGQALTHSAKVKYLLQP